MCIGSSIERVHITLLGITLPNMMVQCDLLNGDQVSRTLDGLGHLLDGSSEFVMLMVGPNREPVIGGP